MLSETRRPLLGRVILGTLAAGATLAASTACGSLPLLPPALSGGEETTSPQTEETSTSEESTETTQPGNEDAPPAEPEDSDVFSLTIGDCWNQVEASADGISEVPKVDCSEPHDYEVYHLEDIPESGSYPGESTVQMEADDICDAQFEPFVGTPWLESSLDYEPLYPTEDGWNNYDDREVICSISDYSGDQLTGSMEGSGL